ncbi:hypothetical protein VQH23_03655 [Pararoseomonas sp. SCSIO 73927]|uniref:hypothetical protein n=1 Tax=Pararoseomonas sp. SCSIO 73927 TaxID=3114537 RepID=UPI0030CEBE9B
MSAAAEYADRLNFAEQVARIERAQEETRKFVAEQHKLQAEAAKFQRDTRLAPWLAGGAVAGGVVTVTTLLFRALGVLS